MIPRRPSALVFPYALAVASWLLLGGCGVTRLQSARTVSRGETRTTVAVGIIHNRVRDLGNSGVSAFPVDVMVRHGATDRIDWGLRLLFGFGVLGDVKWNLLPNDHKTALAISAGLGAAEADGEVIHVPLTVTASRDFLPWLTPYAAVGYGTYWIFGYGDRDPTVSYAPRTGTGDGLLTLHAGIELTRASGRALLLEYAYARPVVNDPGDFFRFAPNHFFSIGFHTGRAAATFPSR